MKTKSIGKKNKGFRFLSCVTAAFMIFAATAGTSVYAADKMTKEETVYVITDASGSQKEAIVSDHLCNVNSLDTITDVTELKDIENVKGDEEFKKGSGNQIIWQADGNDIYYQGKTDEKAPVTLNIEYYLDGKKVSGSDLDGKSGDVKIKIKYENNCQVTVDGRSVKVPFVVMTGFMVEDDCFKNVSVSSGKVIDDGEKQVVAVMAVPGLADSLGVSPDKLGFSDEVEITGTAEDFSLEDMMTVVTGNIFEDVDSGELASLDLDGQINELDSAATQLAKGASTLYDGIHMLSDKSTALKDGVSKLDAGAQQLNAGASQALEGSQALAAGSAQLSAALDENLGTMKSSAADLYAGSQQVCGGLLALQNTINGTSTNMGLVTAAENVQAVITNLSNEVEQAKNTSKTSIDAAKEIVEDLFKTGSINADTYNKLITELETALGAQEKIAIPSELNAGVEGICDGLSKVSGALAGNGTKENPGLVAGATVLQEGIAQLDSGLGAATADTKSLTSSANELAAGASQLADGQTALSSGAKELADGMTQLSNSSVQLIGGIKQLDRGAMELSKGMQQFYEQGIRKIVDLYNSDLKGVTGNVKSVIKAGQQYDTFTQLPDSMSGNVKFIYKTEIAE